RTPTPHCAAVHRQWRSVTSISESKLIVLSSLSKAPPFDF
ncbi:MAG: hypothetical protein ACI9UA_003663, partial [Pseudoalteromonas tetraodonis]